ncbi:MAG: NAD(P)H-hydrate epimerase [Sodalis sp. (in: enterobacteria)]|uniref:NAD(P)H-hydrate epimerase n=1 Tax=Sodalis sp. (in: enterobacteria) TaxID=1898979 RepID=UPI003F2BA52E
MLLAGHGNNGRDGYVVAKLAGGGKQVTVLAYDGQHPLPAEAEQAKAAWRAAGGEIHPADQPWPEEVEVINRTQSGAARPLPRAYHRG